MNNVFPKCVICGNHPENGLYDGIRLASRFICSVCEDNIIQSNAHTNEYQDIVQAVKRILYPKQSYGQDKPKFKDNTVSLKNLK
ncbi:MAG: hypothetical protein GX434_05715 [Peptococcaceae bacterium]|nr:hypothetical protein [Peptococcaceae bacterium]